MKVLIKVGKGGGILKITTKVSLYIGLSLLLLIVLYLYELERQIDSPGIEGTIIISEADAVFIVLDSNFENEDVDLPIEELQAKYKNVGRLSIHQSDYRGELKTGQRVKVWMSQTMESSPPIFKAIKLERL
ncbi:DUF3221 domain-containing protein [Pradoshia sp. D12]|nr:hypothetical protein A8L44_07380 [Bacillus sp. FJAT-27986]QFK72020.1 DUF3221 domain-containing protein [Pradoshia sp. D12]TPF71488.1 DUF3221 domain-containing protein [Bacillus sp. D12]